MLEKVNVRRIVVDHLHTLRITGNDSISARDIALFFGIPAFITALSIFLFGLNVNTELGNALFTGLAIFAGLLFNLLVLVYDIVNRENRGADVEDKRFKRRLTVLREVFANVSYSILIALVIVFLIGMPKYTTKA